MPRLYTKSAILSSLERIRGRTTLGKSRLLAGMLRRIAILVVTFVSPSRLSYLSRSLVILELVVEDVTPVVRRGVPPLQQQIMFKGTVELFF